jgi:hypothetical protein
MNISDTIIIIYISIISIIISPLVNKSSMQRDNGFLAMRSQQERHMARWDDDAAV